MDENLNSNSENDSKNPQNNNVSEDTSKQEEINIRKFSMDDKGNIRHAGAVAASSRTFIILGWICAAFAAFISPYFALAGVTFGILANRKLKSSGNTIIITNVVLGLINLLFGLIFLITLRRFMLGY